MKKRKKILIDNGRSISGWSIVIFFFSPPKMLYEKLIFCPSFAEGKQAKQLIKNILCKSV